MIHGGQEVKTNYIFLKLPYGNLQSTTRKTGDQETLLMAPFSH